MHVVGRELDFPVIPPTEPILGSPLESLSFGRSINFNILFRIKGRKNLWFPLQPKAQNNGMIGMIEFGVDNHISVNYRHLECLGSMVFFKNDGTTIRMGEVFDNLEKIEFERLKKWDEKMIVLMELMVPDFNMLHFKIYHAEKVLAWYLEIKEKLELYRKK